MSSKSLFQAMLKCHNNMTQIQFSSRYRRVKYRRAKGKIKYRRAFQPFLQFSLLLNINELVSQNVELWRHEDAKQLRRFQI